MRLLIVPQYPTKMRYQEWWSSEFPKQLSKKFEVKIIGEKYPFSKSITNPEMFSPISQAIDFENYQINEYMNMTLWNDDILLLNDISFPGLFSNVLYHKKPKKCYAICHATSINNLDYFGHVHDSKWLVETGHSKLFNKVFVATDYHKKKLNKWKNTVVTFLPKHEYTRYNESKLYDIINVSRPTPQKVDERLEKIISKRYSNIVRKTTSTWDDYYKFLSQSKCLFISSKEETFGYQILDSVYNNCVPIAPNNFSYPELLPREYLYENDEEAFHKVGNVLSGQLRVPKIICQEKIDKFYDNLIGEINAV